jgi:hypothetical protein
MPGPYEAPECRGEARLGTPRPTLLGKKMEESRLELRLNVRWFL